MAIGTPYVVCQAAYASGSATETTQVGTGGGAASNAGDCLVAWLTTNAGSGTLLSVSDSVNGTWTAVGSEIDGASLHGRWFMMPNAGALSLSQGVGGVWSGTGGGKTMQVFGIPGLTMAAIADAVATATSATGTHPAVASGTLRSANEIVLIGLANSTGDGSATWASPFTIAGVNQQTGTSQYGSVAYDIVAATTSVTPTATLPSGGNWAVSLISIPAPGLALPADTAGAADTFLAVNQVTVPDVAGAVEAFTAVQGKPLPDQAGSVETASANATVPVRDAVAGLDTISVSTSRTISFTPAASTSTAIPDIAVEYTPGSPYPGRASPAFIISQMPRLYLLDLPTSRWLHRDVQGVTSPLITWQLNAPGTFACTLAPPRPELLDGTGNPAIRLWQTAAFLEEANQVKFGGICTTCNAQGPQLALVFTEYTTYPSGIPYTGPAVTEANYDALDAVRALWAWLQAQAGGNLGLVLDTVKCGVLLGDNGRITASSILTSPANPGDKTVQILPPVPTPGTPLSTAFTLKAQVQIGNDTPNNLITYAGTDHLNLANPINSAQPTGSIVGQLQKAIPYTLDWWNATDCGQEISSIQAEAVFDFQESHTWGDPGKQTITHRLAFGVPRIGTRRSELRFAEGENITIAATGTQDGTAYASEVLGIGAGTGSASVRATSAVRDGRIRRVTTYSNQTIDRPDRLATLTSKVLASVLNPDAITQVTVINHPNAPFGSFGPGDDIPVMLASGWRNGIIWSRITAMAQDPTTSLMTLTLARSDSFDYVSASGAGGTL